MKLTTKTTYGLRAIIELSQNYNKAPLKRKEISERQGISEAYLENILLILISSGIISSIRGPDGGYILNRPPSLIKLGEIIEVLDGQFDPIGSTTNTKLRDKVYDCYMKKIWIKLKNLQRDFLYSITLEDIINLKL